MSTTTTAVHSTHEAAAPLGGIGTVLRGLLPEPNYRARFGRSVLVGGHPLAGRPPLPVVHVDTAGEAVSGSLGEALAVVAQRFGGRIVYGEREVAPGTPVEVLLISPNGLRREPVEAFRDAVERHSGIDLRGYDHWPAVRDGRDRRIERVLDPHDTQPDEPEELVLDSAGRPLPGGARWVDDRAVFPPIANLAAFLGFEAANKYLIELQFHTFVAPALWAALRVVLGETAPSDVTLFAHDWVGVPLWWAARAAGERVGQAVYVAHECRVFRLLAEGALALGDYRHVFAGRCSPTGYDAALYPLLDEAMAKGWGLADMFPGSDGFERIYHHRIGREAAGFDRLLAVGPLVRDEWRVALRPAEPPIHLCPNGVPPGETDLDRLVAARGRLQRAAEDSLGFRPEVIFTGVMRYEISKAPWRNVGLFERFAERAAEHSAVFYWLSAPRVQPSAEQVERWAAEYRWPLDHRGGPGGDLRPEEEPLWAAIAALNERFSGRCAMLYINYFGWPPGRLGAWCTGDSSFADRVATDVEVGLSVYEPFGIAPIEPFGSGAICALSDSCGCAKYLEELGYADRVLIGRFRAHGLPPTAVDSAALRQIESAVYDDLVDGIMALLGDPKTEWRQRRADRVAAAQAILDRLSWTAVVTDHLLPAIG